METNAPFALIYSFIKYCSPNEHTLDQPLLTTPNLAVISFIRRNSNFIQYLSPLLEYDMDETPKEESHRFYSELCTGQYVTLIFSTGQIDIPDPDAVTHAAGRLPSFSSILVLADLALR